MGDQVVVIPYVMPGFDLARLCAERFPEEAGPQTIGMVLLNHGIFSFGDTARESYERMIELVRRAEEYLKARKRLGAGSLPGAGGRSSAGSAGDRPAPPRPLAAAGFPMILSSRRDARTPRLRRRPDVAAISQQGPATPDHVIRTKRLPLVGRDVAAYRRRLPPVLSSEHALLSEVAEPRTMLDPAPRVILDPELGLLAAGRTAEGRRHRRRDLRAHHGHHRAGRAARRLPGALRPATSSTWSTGTSSRRSSPGPASRRSSPARSPW